MNTEEVIEWLRNEECFWECISLWESISTEENRRTYPQEELTWTFIWLRDQLIYKFLDGRLCDPRLAKSLQWLFDNTDRILSELCDTNFTADWMTLPERVRFVGTFCGAAIIRISLNCDPQVSRESHRTKQD